MIDLETMSTRPTAAIVSIGAVAFDYTDNDPIKNTFYTNVVLDDSDGSQIDGETVMWWMEQSNEARKALTYPTPIYLPFALENLKAFIEDNMDKYTRLWSHNNFDSPIIRDSFRRCGLKFPISFRRDRDIRTILDVYNDLYSADVPIERDGVLHNALDDAIYQAKVVTYILKHLS